MDLANPFAVHARLREAQDAIEKMTGRSWTLQEVRDMLVAYEAELHRQHRLRTLRVVE